MSQSILTIIHFNDAYDIQPNLKGDFGIVRFQAHIRKIRKQNPNNLLLFSGDCYSPSILSNIFQGRQMVKALNKLNIDAACYGNHQFDFGSDHVQQLYDQCTFPWLLGNIKYQGTEINLGGGKAYMTKQINGLHVGFFGVASQDWMSMIDEDEQKQIVFIDPFDFSREMCKILKQELKCDIIVALTHMRKSQDQKLPEEVPDIDIVLGGHDHIVMQQFINQIPVIKSLDNFKKVSIIKLYKKDSKKQTKYSGRNYNFDVQFQDIPSIPQENPCQYLQNLVSQCLQQYEKCNDIIGYTEVQLNIQLNEIRKKQSAYGNFLTDLMRLYYDSDCAILNSGCIRCDKIVQPGPIKYATVSNLMSDIVIVKQVSGAILRQVLQFNCKTLPNSTCGSFLCVSGIRYTYDVTKTPRVQSIEVGETPLDQNKNYSIAMTNFVAQGGNDYNMFKKCRDIVNSQLGRDLLNLILSFFKGFSYQKKVQIKKLSTIESHSSFQSNANQNRKKLKKYKIQTIYPQKTNNKQKNQQKQVKQVKQIKQKKQCSQQQQQGCNENEKTRNRNQQNSKQKQCQILQKQCNINVTQQENFSAKQLILFSLCLSIRKKRISNLIYRFVGIQNCISIKPVVQGRIVSLHP